MLLNLDKHFVGLAGDALENDPKMAKLLADNLARSSDDNPIKLWDIAQNLHKNGQIEIDRTDLDLLIAFVKKSKDIFNVLSSAQLITELEKLKLESLKK